MATTVTSRIASFDHATVPSIDLIADHQFYKKFFGAVLPLKGPGEPPSLVNFSIERRLQGRAAIFFLEFAGHVGYGLFLQSEYPLEPSRLLEGPRYGMAVAGASLEGAIAAFNENGVEFLGPVVHEPGSPLKESIYFKEPSGNSLELYVWRSDEAAARPAAGGVGLIPLSGLSHLALDVVDL